MAFEYTSEDVTIELQGLLGSVILSPLELRGL